jgi:glucosamine--fructose-6-phosphate aminotransferase (isomerizing)
VISLITQKDLIQKSISNLKEVKARGASIIIISQFDEKQLGDVYDHLIKLPKVDSLFSPFVSIVVLQLLAYYFALLKGNDVDKPRNLAKSVTVE